MSEEMKQKAIEFLSGYSDCNLSFQDGTIDRGTVAEAMAEFAAQVCEQREKEHGNQFCERHIDTTLAVANVSEPCPLCQLEHRARSAELALQRKDEAIKLRDEAGEDLQTLVKQLRAALQAKEQELDKELDVPLCGDCAESWFTMRDNLPRKDGCVFCASVAQARQQAIAECMKIARSPYSDEVGCRAGDDPADVGAKISEGTRRSLTPPPALTKEK